MQTLTEQPGIVRRLIEALSRSRSRRVMVLIIGVVVLSIGDLIVTVGHLQSVGMMEANPIAVWLIKSSDSPFALISYKLGTVGICVALLLRVREHIEGEIAAAAEVDPVGGESRQGRGQAGQRGGRLDEEIPRCDGVHRVLEDAIEAE